MECSDVRTGLLDYLEGELPFEETRQIRSHLSRCYYCQEELDDIKATLATCRRVLRHPRPVNRFDKLAACLASAPPQVRAVTLRPKSPFHVLLTRAAVAAGFVLFALCAPPMAEGMRKMTESFHAPALNERAELSPARPAVAWDIFVPAGEEEGPSFGG